MAEERGQARGSGNADRINAEAIGEPGSRRFRLLTLVEGETRIVWLEKEQLRRLGEALEQVLDQLPERGLDQGPNNAITSYALDTRFQLRAGRMELGYDEARDRLIIIAHDIDAEAASPAIFECRISRLQARDLAEEADEVVSAGRPRCPLCGMPMGPGPHSCAKQNGHHPERLEDVEGEAENDEAT